MDLVGKPNKVWSTTDTCKLIELYRESPVLWDARCPDYKNRYKKADALLEFAEALSTTPDSIDKKIKNITSQYAREKRLHEKATKSGAGKEFHSKWFGFNLMEFLKDKNQPRKTIEGGIQESECENEEDDVLSVIYDEHTDDNNTDVSKENSIRFEKPSTVNTKTVTIPCITKVKRHEERSAKAFSILEAMHNDKKSRHAKLEKEKEQLDEFHSFGDMIGKQLRSLKTHHAQSTVQYLMNNIMYEAKMGRYDHPPSLTDTLYIPHPNHQTYGTNILNMNNSPLNNGINNNQDNEEENNMVSNDSPRFLSL